MLEKKEFVLIRDRKEFKDLMKCPKCDLISRYKKPNYKCSGCDSTICVYCHEFHSQTSEPCLSSKVKEIIIDPIGSVDIRYCPNCDEPCMKDDRCDHVVCGLCHLEFCYFCMVEYRPINHHGSSRHRKDCRNYR